MSTYYAKILHENVWGSTRRVRQHEVCASQTRVKNLHKTVMNPVI